MRRLTPAMRAAASATTLAFALAAAPLAAQTAPAADDQAAAADTAADANGPVENDIVVVGTTGAGKRRQDAAFALTTVDAGQIAKISPSSTADLLKVVPGVSAETSGGQNGANIFVRGYPSGGDAQFVTLQIEGVPFFSPATLSFLENSQLIRVDQTISRVEAVRGGTGALFASGQPGLTVNFVQREGGRDFEGLAKLSVTDYGEVRGDGYVSGPIGPDTTFMVGGFYHTSHGIRDPQFTAEKGGQITANVRHNFDRGSVLVYGRYLNDRGQWLLPIPVIQSGNKISAYPGFDPGSGTFLSNELRLGTLNDGTRVDVADGRGARITNLGANFEYELADGLTARYRTSWLKGDADTTGDVPSGPAPQSATDFAAALGGTIASLTYANGGGTVSPTTQVIQTGTWVVRKQIENWSNDLSLEFKSGRNTLTVGGYYAGYSSNDQWNLGNGQLITATPNARRLNLTIVNNTSGATQQVTRNGFAQGSFYNVNAAYDGKDYAFYAVDEFQITPDLRVDAGIRWQQHEIDGTLENNTFGVDTDGNPNTLYNNGTAVLNGTYSTLRYRNDKVSWTVGANYAFTSRIGVFARYSRGHSFPSFDDLRDNPPSATQPGAPTIQVDTYEGGLKLSTHIVSAYLTIFHNDFKGLQSSVITMGVPIVTLGGAKTTGVELEGAVRPLPGLSIGFAGTWLDAKYSNYRDSGGAPLDGNRVQRQPRWQWRINPSYEVEFGNDNKATIFTTIAYIGDRFSDVQNAQLLPHYYKWDAGLQFDLGKRLQFQVSADNITNTIGLTEGNPRTIGTQGSGPILARPILGRSVLFSVGYKF